MALLRRYALRESLPAASPGGNLRNGMGAWLKTLFDSTTPEGRAAVASLAREATSKASPQVFSAEAVALAGTHPSLRAFPEPSARAPLPGVGVSFALNAYLC